MEQFTDIVKDLFMSFAVELSKHKLSSKMTPDQIMTLVMGQPVSSKATPEKTVYLWEGELGELPKGISEKRARELLAIAEAGVPDGMKIHTKKKELFKPNKQHAQFYTNGPFSGPKEDEEIIDWLVELAGDVGPPPEPEVVAQLPAKWANDKKKAVNLLVLVTNNKKKAAEKGEEYKPISWDTSRGHQHGEDDFLYDDEFDICGPKKTKAEFLNLVAWYKEHPGVVEEAVAKANPKPKEKAAKGKKATKAKEAKKDKEDKESDDESAPAKKVTEDSDELSSESSADDADEDDKLFVKGYDEAKLKKLRAKLADLKEGEYINMESLVKLKNTEKSAKTFTFNDEFQVAVPKTMNVEDVVKMLSEC